MTRFQRDAWAKALAFAFLDGDWTEPGLLRRVALVLGHRKPSVRRFVTRVRRAYPRPPWDRWRELAAWIGTSSSLEEVVADSDHLFPARWLPFQPAMGEMRWPVPAIPTLGELAHFLGVTASELAWFADVRSLERRVSDERLRHYRYRWVRKTAGGLRLIEEPKTRLREIQRLLLRTILDHIPSHPAAYGFIRGRSARHFAEHHAGADLVIRFDLEDFFGSVSAGRAYGVFRTAGYPESVAHHLAGLATNVVPLDVWQAAPKPEDATGSQRHFHQGRRLTTPHLPQGAPTSPALANLCAHGMDRRLSGLAESFGLKYARYADDIAISGSPSPATADKVVALIDEIVTDEGFHLNVAKTVAMGKGHRQRLTGIVVNRKPNLARPDYDRLRAILHNAGHEGVESQNRSNHPRFAQHLAGRVTWAASLNPVRGPKLRSLLSRAVGSEDASA